MKKVRKSVLITLADKNYINQAKQLFSSAYFTGGWDEDYLLLSYKIPEKDLIWFRKKGIIIKKCKTIFQNKKQSPVKLCKFYLFDKFFKRWEKLIYLDGDIIITNSIKNLKNLNKFSATLDIVPKIKNQFLLKNNKKLGEKLGNDFDLNSKAFNSGVIIFNTKIIKNESISKLKKIFIKYNKLLKKDVIDQPILNLFFYKNWAEISPIYNIFPLSFNKKIKQNYWPIIHFIGKEKPWNKNSQFYNLWKLNLIKANQINIKKPKNIKSLSLRKRKKYLHNFIKRDIILNKIKELKEYLHKIKELKEYLHNLIKKDKTLNKIEKLIGKFGIIIKKKNNTIYKILKKIDPIYKIKYFRSKRFSLKINLKEIKKKRDKLQNQINKEEIITIIKVIKKKRPCKFLVFGLGIDTPLWVNINKDGRTVFLEDLKEWHIKIKKEYKKIESYLIKYNTKIENWKNLISKPEKLTLKLPKKLINTKWDIILIDGPRGYKNGQPGRMKSIFMASKLIKKNGDIFVHDSDREVESMYTNKFLKNENLIKQVCKLKHYQMKTTP